MTRILRTVPIWLAIAPGLAIAQVPTPQAAEPLGASNAPYATVDGVGGPSPYGGGPAVPDAGFPASTTATPEATGFSPGLGGGLASTGGAINMIGDQAPFQIRPGRRSGTIAPSVSGIKVCENQSPRPQDRFYYSFNYYDDLGADLNRALGVPLTDVRAYRHIFGAEKTFNAGQGSVGFRLPLNQVTANPLPGRNPPLAGGTSTSLGDLSVYAKYILAQDEPSGSLLSAGLIVTPPTGPGSFAGAPYFNGSIHTTVFQPFLGYIWNYGDFFFQGFFSGAFPAQSRDVTILYNDVGVGYYLYRATDEDRFLTALAPMFEVHVNTPLNHRREYDPNDPSGTADAVNLTYGLSALFGRNSLLTLALVTPVTGPRPFDLEAVAQLNVFFGRRRAPAIPVLPPPVIGG